MDNRKFKIGDTVRIIDTSTIPDCELNKVGIIVNIERYSKLTTYTVDIGMPRRPNEPNETCWWLSGNCIELFPAKYEQLLFEFMMD